MKFYFDDGKHHHRFEFVFRREFPDRIDVVSISRERIKYRDQIAWMLEIKDGKIIWLGQETEYLYLTQEAKNYIDKVVKLISFA